MALLSDIDITVCQRRVDSGAYKASSSGSGGQMQTKMTAKTKYLVVCKEKSGGPALSPSDLNPLLIVNTPSLPSINRTAYSFGGLTAPFMICTGKQIERDRENGFLFHVTADFESIQVGMVAGRRNESPEQSPQEEIQPKDKEELDNFDKIPTIVSFTTSSQEFVKYDAKYMNGRGSRQSWKLPTGTPFEEPIVDKVPLITLSISQFEDELTLTDLEKRSFTINKEEWNGRNWGQWLLAEIDATQVTVNLKDGARDMWRVTYKIHLSPDHQVEVIVDNEPKVPGFGFLAGDFFDPGWAVLRPLVDTYYLEEHPESPSNPDVLKPNADLVTGYVSPCYIYESNGRKREPTNTDGTGDDRPSYMAFMPYRESDFNSFLKWPAKKKNP